MPPRLSVNVNAIAFLRNRRDLPWPSLTHLGAIALEAGAHGLTVHPRPDERHVRASDLGSLRALIDDRFPHAEFNIEGYPDERFIALVERHQPEQATLVPDDPAQATSDHGWDCVGEGKRLSPLIRRLKAGGVRVSVFVDADPGQMQAARDAGADRVELYTGPYGACHDDADAAKRELDRLQAAADAARQAGLGVNAGHDLTVANLPALVRRVPFLAEVSIGHAIAAEAFEFGMAETVRRFRRACGDSPV